MRIRITSWLLLHSLCVAAFGPTVLITGANGRTGSQLYHALKADSRIGAVRAFVHNASKARESLNCSKCDESEGIFVGDVTNASTMVDAMHGVHTLAIAAGTVAGASVATMKAVEFDGVVNSVTVLASQPNATLASLRVVFCSSMKTSNPNPPAFEGGKTLFYKLNAEAFIASSGVGFTIVKPCGLTDKPAGVHERATCFASAPLFSPRHTLHYWAGVAALGTNQSDALPWHSPGFISRGDVAAVMAEATAEGLRDRRFSLCNKLGKGPSDIVALLRGAVWPWQEA